MLWSDRFLDTYFYLTQGKRHLTDACLYVHGQPSSSSSSLMETTECTASLVPTSQFMKSDDDDNTNRVRLVVISDTHGKHRSLGKLPAADLLIHCGEFHLFTSFRSQVVNSPIYHDF